MAWDMLFPDSPNCTAGYANCDQLQAQRRCLALFTIITKTYRVYHALCFVFFFTQISNMATNMPVKLVLRGTSNISLNERWGYLRAPTAVTLYILLTVIMTQYGTVTSHCVWSLHPYTSVHISGIEPYMMSWEIFLHKWSKPFLRQLNNTVVRVEW